MFIIILLINFLNFNNCELINQTKIPTICSNLNKINLKFISTDNYLIAYYRKSFNKTFDNIIYRKISDLNLNFDLSPTKIYLVNNQKIKLIKKEFNFKIYTNSSRIQFVFYKKSSNSINYCLNKLKIFNCLIKTIDNCIYDNQYLNLTLNSYTNQLENKLIYQIYSKNWICINRNNLIYHHLNSTLISNTQINTNQLNGLALIKLRNFNLTKLIIFNNESINFYQTTDLFNKLSINSYQPNSIFLGCPQNFCFKSTFDDIIYDSFLDQLIIYRGQYFYQFNIFNNLSIDSYYLNEKFAKSFYTHINGSLKNQIEELAFFDAVELIYDDHNSTNKPIRIHIKEDNVYLFDHFKNELILITKLIDYLPNPQPKFVDSMFYLKGYLNLLSGKYIYSYYYKDNKFIFKKLSFKFRLPSYIEATFYFNNKIYFFKENQFYINELNDHFNNQNKLNQTKLNDKLNKFNIVNKFIVNCSKLNLKESYNFANLYRSIESSDFIESYSNYSDKANQIKKLNINLTLIFLIGFAIVFTIILLVSLFIFFEYFSTKKRSYLDKSIKIKNKGLIYHGRSNSSPSNKEFLLLLEKNRERFLSRMNKDQSNLIKNSTN